MRRVALVIIVLSFLIMVAIGVLLVTQSGDDTGDLEEMSMDQLVEDIETYKVVLVTAKGEHLEVSYDINEDPTRYVDTGKEVTNLPEYLKEQGVNPLALSGRPALAYEDTSEASNYLESYGLAVGGVAAVLFILGFIVFIRSDGSKA